jgi:GMP synthase-like glutamine amidotransferase
MIAFIDPFINNPVIYCYNELVEYLNHPMTYHMPAKCGVKSLVDSADSISAYIVAGSASNVTEPLEWHKPLADFLVSELKKGKPVLGACFGHQLLCHAFGSEVDYAFPSQDKLLGLRQIKMTEDIHHFRKDEIIALAVTHRQVVKTLGPGLKSVGESLANDIVIHETLPLLTTQAHPEASKYFCSFDIQNLSQDEEDLVRKDGKTFIKNFLNYYKVL